MHSDLNEILSALEMPREGLEKWFRGLEEFCSQHGGDRHYSVLLRLIHECGTALGTESTHVNRTELP